jgi:hypothetical protein
LAGDGLPRRDEALDATDSHRHQTRNLGEVCISRAAIASEHSSDVSKILTSGAGGVRSFLSHTRSDAVPGSSAASPFFLIISFPSSALSRSQALLGNALSRSSASPSQAQCAIHAALISDQKRSFENLRSQAGAWERDEGAAPRSSFLFISFLRSPWERTFQKLCFAFAGPVCNPRGTDIRPEAEIRELAFPSGSLSVSGNWIVFRGPR